MNEELKKALDDMKISIIREIKSEIKREVSFDKIEARRHEQKLHNTKLLLKNYRKFKKHVDQAEFTAASLIDEELLDMLEIKYETKADETYLKSILRTKARTAKMLTYIINVLEFNVYQNKGRKKEQNMALTLKLFYIDGLSQSKIAEKLDVDDRTVRRYLEEGPLQIAPLMFGVDGLKLS